MLLFFFFFHFFLQFNYFDTLNNHLNFKQDPITNVWSTFRKNDISICFVHKSQKWAIFGLTCKDKRSRDLVTIGPIFFLKMCKTLKKKVSERRGAIHMRSRTIRKNCGGGAIMGPPPPALLGLSQQLFSTHLHLGGEWQMPINVLSKDTWQD